MALPKLPKPQEFAFEIDYYSTLCDAYAARLRVAVAELQKHTHHAECEDCWYSCSTICCNERRKSAECDCGAHQVADVLAAIGELPEEST